MSNQSKTTGSKAPMNVRVAEKTMPLTKWFIEQYYQTYEACSKDPRYKTLPPYNQTSCIATIMIATNAALDKAREARDAKKEERVAKLNEVSQQIEQSAKIA